MQTDEGILVGATDEDGIMDMLGSAEKVGAAVGFWPTATAHNQADDNRNMRCEEIIMLFKIVGQNCILKLLRLQC